MPTSKHLFRTVSLLTFLLLLTQTHISYGDYSPAPTDGVTYEHNDEYWASLAQDEPAYRLDASERRVASSTELDDLGQWSGIIEWPHIPVSVANLPDGRLVTWAASQTTSFPENDPEFTYSAIWDPQTGLFIDANNPTHNMFCAHNVMLEDGTVFANGGRDTTEFVSTFDYQTESWTQIESMDQKRWYPTTVALPSGDVFTALGDGATPYPEIWSPANGWSELSGVDLSHVLVSEYDLSMEWPFLTVAPDNTIFHAGPTPQMHSISLIDHGDLTHRGTLPDDSWYAKDGTYVMYDEGKMLVMGGRDGYEGNTSINKAMIIDINGPTPVITPTQSMSDSRSHHSAVMMPNGEVFVVGGSALIKKFSDAASSYTPEVWNPDTGEWRQMADMQIPRNYHSVAILMPDGRILVGGGGLSEDRLNVNHADAEIFSPHYLFDEFGNLASRPTIDSAPATVGYGETFTVNTSEAIGAFSLIKLSSITHQMNTDLRYLEPTFVETAVGQYELTTHTNPSVLTPGYYMLFAINGDGVPSEAHIVQVNSSHMPQITHPGNQTNTQGEQVQLPILATNPLAGQLTYTAENLPTGLTIDSNSGEISGVISFDSEETHKATITVSNGTYSASIVIFWEIDYLLSEAGRVAVNQTNGEAWHTVDLYYTYQDPIVVMGPASHSNGQPTTIRLRNVSNHGFEFQLDEWDYLDGTHPTESVYYLVVEAGTYQLADGELLTAVSTTSDHTLSTETFPTAYDAPPIVLAQAVSASGTEAIVSQLSNVSTTQFNLSLQEEEANDGMHSTETVHWIAIDATTVTDRIEAGTFASAATASWYGLTFQQTYSAAPIFLADQQTANGTDPAALRYRALSAGDVDVRVEEEASADAELVPASETIGYLVIEPSIFNNPFSPNALPPNHAPVFAETAVNQTNTEGDWLTLNFSATDADNDSLMFSATGLPENVTINEYTGKISGPVVAGEAGDYSVTVFVNDQIFSTAQSFTWSINPAEGGWSAWADETDSRLSLSGTDSYEKDIAVGDLDKDGWDDIIIVRKNPFDAVGGQADILLMNVNGELVDKTSDFAPQFLTTLTDARDVVMADLDGDGWLDVLIATTFEDPPVLYRNQGQDAFGDWRGLTDESSRLPVSYDTDTVQFCAVVVGDVNGDDHVDVYFANYAFEEGAQDVLLINDGSGNFTEESDARLGELRNSAFGTSAQIVDMNGDGDNDIVKLSAEYAVEPFNKDGIFTLFNDGDGTFTTFEEIPSTDAYMFMVGHLNDDTIPDVFVQEDAQDSINFGTAVSFTNQPITSIRTASHGGNFRFADVDNDGDLDIGVADVDTMFPPCDTGADSLRKFVILKNDGDGNMSDPYGATQEVWNQNMFDFDFVDIDRDGNLDIFAAECEGYGVYMNTAVPSANQPPIINDLTDQSNNEGDTVSLNISATDADHDPLTITVTGLPESLSYNATTKKIAGQLALTDAGLYIVTITASDGELTDTNIFVWAIGEVNKTPVLVTPIDQTFLVGQTIGTVLVASDYENDTLTFTITGLPPSIWYNATNGFITGTFSEADVGTHVITAVVSDGSTQDSATFQWVVEQDTAYIYLPLIVKQ